MSPLSFLIVFIWILSLFFLMSLLKGLLILFIFSKSQLLDLLILLIVLFLKIFYLFIFKQRGREREQRERNINVWLPLACPYQGPGLQPRYVL